jgi:hypothetical protein
VCIEGGTEAVRASIARDSESKPSAAPRWVERLVRSRWPTLFQTIERSTGIVMLLLDLSMISPVLFSHVVLALVVMLLALAYLEEDEVSVCCSKAIR